MPVSFSGNFFRNIPQHFRNISGVLLALAAFLYYKRSASTHSLVKKQAMEVQHAHTRGEAYTPHMHGGLEQTHLVEWLDLPSTSPLQNNVIDAFLSSGRACLCTLALAKDLSMAWDVVGIKELLNV